MKIFRPMLVVVLFLFVFKTLRAEDAPAAAPAPVPGKQEQKESTPREVYGQVYRTLAMASFSAGYREAALRKGSFGLGVSGSFILRVDNWNPSPFREGFVNLELNYWAHEFINIAAFGGYHSDPGGSAVYPISGTIQLLIPQLTTFEKNPGLNGIELGAVYYSSSIADESKLCFKLGFVSYSTLNEHSMWFNSVSWLTPGFRDNNWEWKTGFKYYFF